MHQIALDADYATLYPHVRKNTTVEKCIEPSEIISETWIRPSSVASLNNRSYIMEKIMKKMPHLDSSKVWQWSLTMTTDQYRQLLTLYYRFEDEFEKEINKLIPN